MGLPVITHECPRVVAVWRRGGFNTAIPHTHTYGHSVFTLLLQTVWCSILQGSFQALSSAGGITLHIDKLHGFNSHHIVEAAFKSVARALRVAVETDPRKADAIPSTKGAL